MVVRFRRICARNGIASDHRQGPPRARDRLRRSPAPTGTRAALSWSVCAGRQGGGTMESIGPLTATAFRELALLAALRRRLPAIVFALMAHHPDKERGEYRVQRLRDRAVGAPDRAVAGFRSSMLLWQNRFADCEVDHTSRIEFPISIVLTEQRHLCKLNRALTTQPEVRKVRVKGSGRAER